LKVRWELGNLVQEERAAMRLLERPAVRLDRARKRAALVPEELGLDELARKPSAVEWNEWAFGAPPSIVKGVRDVLFADACLASNQNGP
jgi:hypothetical protein